MRTACLCWLLGSVLSLGAMTSMLRAQSCTVPLPACASDIDGDQSVEVDDLVAVILSWGQVGPPRPEGDVAPLPNGDCTVNVDDLVRVILTWGACPSSSGACCIGGSCSIHPPAQCASLGGVYQGDNTTCAGVNCALANDNCAGAVLIQASLFPAPPIANNFSNANATNGNVPGASCTFGAPGNMTRDVWFRYTVPTAPDLSGYLLRLDLCSTADPFNNTVLAVYSGTCAALTQIACSDNACGANGMRSSLETPLIPAGATAYIRVGSWGIIANNQGPFILHAQAQAITNDQCPGAIEIPIGGSITDNLADATQDFAETCQGVNIGRANWYQVTGNGTTLTASTCSSETGVYDGTLSVYCAGSAGCNALNCVAATDEDIGTPQGPECPAFQGEEVSWCAADDQTYWIAVSVAATGLPKGETGPYTLTITSDNQPGCTITADCNEGVVPANDECANALVVMPGNTPFSNAMATPQMVGPGTICGQPWSKDVWFRYTSANGGTVGLTLASSPVFDSMVQVFTASSTCAALTQLLCEDDDATCGACHPNVSWTAAAGATYIIRITTWSDSAGGFANLVITDP